ncbi:aminotransferase-like domain-containing protein [Acinetobacter shaoyimingii]|uniref:PLP-dependent aminotransferase family protein n=1 Tax=Acinetobacter shaoyimingii TaxID=2715164 RepID=A0A6G8RVV4_9GAMM|nr:PLP-dependent aminotransferase family protein [Acinetobacter shaoyimingii]NHB57477.1 PLP-dependent aminotransferase family protein [Acinetobacter shaoyimingii]QIO05928.1 PLP-dependent aminotransferase family protein [Acinetobacter shaoyimingii]
MLKTTKIENLVQMIQTQIANHTLIPGERLPSVRQMAEQMSYSVSTVIEAYARLVAMNIIEARKGAGYFVCSPLKTANTIQPRMHYDREVDPLWISRQSLIAETHVIKAGCGWLPNDWMPEHCIRKALKTVATNSVNTLIDYPPPYGHLALREYIAKKNEKYDLNIDTSQILITDSATQSIDLIFRLLLKAGDVILIDDPCYFNFLALINVHHLQAIAIPFTETGPDLKHFENALQHRPKLYLTNSGIHNPTGASLALQTAYQVAKLCEQANVVIIEDDIFSEFEFSPAPRYSALMGLNQVIQIGSFSKTLSASIRCGYIITDHKKIDQLVDLKIATNFSSGHLNAEIIYHAMNDSSYRKHIQHLRQRLINAMNDTLRRLKDLGIEAKVIPKAGLFIWCQLPDEIDAAELSKICLQNDVILAPGSAFSQDDAAKKCLRFNVAQSSQEKVYQVLKTAIEMLRNDTKHSTKH